jgi:integrase/ribosomal protein S27AE
MNERIRGHEWFEVRDKVLIRDDGECRNCGAGSNLVVHHIVPISNQGTNQMSNLVTLCRKCHRLAHNHRWGIDRHTSNQPIMRDIFTTDEISNVLMSIHHTLYTALITTIAKTGMGVGELCNLDFQDVDVNIDAEYSGKITKLSGSGLRIRYGGDIPYNNRRERCQNTIVPVDDQLETELKRWLAIRPDHQHNTSFFTKTTST